MTGEEVTAALPASWRRSAGQDAEDRARITWTPIGQAASLHLHPAVGPAIEIPAGTCGQPALVLLPPITGQSCR